MTKRRILLVGRADSVEKEGNDEWMNYITSVPYFAESSNPHILEWLVKDDSTQLFLIERKEDETYLNLKEKEERIKNGDYDSTYEWKEDENDEYRKMSRLIGEVRKDVRSSISEKLIDDMKRIQEMIGRQIELLSRNLESD